MLSAALLPLTVSLYDERDYSGRCQTFSGDVPDLSTTRIGARTVSSLRIGAPCP
jgi:hypothetical protein